MNHLMMTRCLSHISFSVYNCINT
uniref:Uncharacterized protein n=1 Tax=Rhizophora mucronata TaxID=61149 RepID=A0A2P2PCA0_RHIMU